MPRRALWVILAAALGARGAFLLAGWGSPRRFAAPDSRDYQVLAGALLERGGFSRSEGAPPEVFRTPGYPLFLAGARLVGGGAAVQAAVAAQVLLDVLLCWLVYRLGVLLCSRPVALAAAAIQAVSPAAVAGSLRLLPESLFALVLAAGVLLLAAHFRSGRVAPAAAAGAAVGAACLLRPVGLPMIALAAAVLLRRPRRWRPAAAFLLAAAVFIAPWVARNHLRAGYARLAGVGDYNLFYYSAVPLTEARPDIPLSDRQRLLRARPPGPGGQPDDIRRLNDPDFLRQCRREGLAVIARRPAAYLWLHLRTTLGVFLPAATDVLEIAGVSTGQRGTLGVLRREGLPAAVSHYFAGRSWALWLCLPLLAVTALKYIGALLGAARCLRWRMGPAGWLIALTIAYFVLIPGPAAHARFRVPFAPLLSLLAAAGFRAVGRKKASETTPGAEGLK